MKNVIPRTQDSILRHNLLLARHLLTTDSDVQWVQQAFFSLPIVYSIVWVQDMFMNLTNHDAAGVLTYEPTEETRI